MKYVVVKVGNNAYPIIFPSHLVHEDVANAVIGVLRDARPKDGHTAAAISAGDVTIFDAECAGRSETLAMESRGRIDKLLITTGQYTGYWED
jgi:hypothetical protein